jgi:Na+-transporting NADH:ubiquinone oxidoreductase subunit C
MNTNSNAYTVIYTTLVVVVVAAVLAFTAMKLKPSQEANAKAETLRQMMSAAQIKPTDELYATNNAGVLQLYADNIDEAYTIGLDGQKNGTLSIEKASIELVDNLKPQNKAIKAGGEATLPVYVFKNGYTVIPVYGAGLWGPVWGYIAFQPDCRTIAGAYFDHESETPGLGAKIKDEAWFREKFVGKAVAFGAETLFNLDKNAEESGAANAVDAITGATMTSRGLNEALNVWFKAYESHLTNAADCCQNGEKDCEHCENHKAEEE